jgi:hypothetical protein
MEMAMLNKVETITDYQKLPSTIRHIIEGGKGNISKAEKSYALQNAVATSVRDQTISHDLAIEILKLTTHMVNVVKRF